ncbi:polymorphic toxin-type HINT domain-containing protein [Actinoplanes sp. NPDC023936]|uniref:polymorphic toxin-type HINT domain-containing protein n=1 Tax=Actinoplanes sp. NPDC023936 TaxID=3154910 RepID=UPI0033C01FB8
MNTRTSSLRLWLVMLLALVVAAAGLHAPPAVAAPAPVAEVQEEPPIPVPPLVTQEWNGSTGVVTSNERWVRSVTDLAELTEEPEVRDAALKILATGDAAAIRRWALNDMPVIEEQVRERKRLEAADRLAKVKALVGTGVPGGYFDTEVRRVYAGTDEDRWAFLAYGADIARARDEKKVGDERERAAALRERLRVFAAAAPAGTQVKTAAEQALAGDDKAVSAFFATGYAAAAKADAAAREKHLADLEARNKALEELSDLAKRAERASQARAQMMVAHGNGVRALQRSANAMGGAANAARNSQRILAGGGTVASKAGSLAIEKQIIADQLSVAQLAVQQAQAAAAASQVAAQTLDETGLTYGIEWSAITVGMREAAVAAVGAITTAGHAVDATIATNAAQGSQAQAEAHARQAEKWRQHAADHAAAAAKLAAAAKKQADAAKTAAARTKTAKEQAQAAEAKAWAEAEKTRQQRQAAEAQAAEAERQRKIAEAERVQAEKHRAEAEKQEAIASNARAAADAQAAVADQAWQKSDAADQAASNANNRAWQQEATARDARDQAMAAEREEQTAKAKAQALRAAAAHAETEAEKQEAQAQADEADRQAGIAATAARSARASANTATGAAANARAAAKQAEYAAERAWAAAEKAQAAASAADAAADEAESLSRAVHAARVRADAKAAEATAQQVKAAEAASKAQSLAVQAADEAVKSLWAADRTKAEAQAAGTEAVAASEQAETAVRAAAAAAQSAAGIAQPANTAIALVSPFTGADIDADFVAQVAAQALVIGTEQATAAQARAAEALAAAEAAEAAAEHAADQVRPAYLSAAQAARSAADAAESAAQARQAAAQAAADAAAARTAAASAARADAQARADAAAARQAANEAANDAAIAGRSAQQARDDADAADRAATKAESDAAAARAAATAAEAAATQARQAADSAQQHADSAAAAADQALQHATEAQKAAERAEEAERERAAQELADAIANIPPEATGDDLTQYLTPEELAQLRQAEQEAGMSVLDFIKAEAEDLFWDLSGAGDLVSCVRDGNVVACLWTLVGLLGVVKMARATYKLGKLVPKLLTFLDRIKDAKKRRDALRELARRKKKLKDDEDSCPVRTPNSFLPGTPVLLADGTTVAIEQVKVGDRVLATDPIAGVTLGKPVTAVIVGAGQKSLVDVTIDIDGARGDKTATVTATDNHPFWVPALNDWIDAGRLSQHQWLRTSAGTYAQISAISHHTASTRVHNLTVADLHTYYVAAGDQPVLVHNENCGETDHLGDDYEVTKGPGVYTIHLKDGRKYVGSSHTNMRERVNDSLLNSNHAVSRAKYKRDDIQNVTWTDYPFVSPRRGSRLDTRTGEQNLMDEFLEGGTTLVNQKYPEVPMPHHVPDYVGKFKERGQLPYAKIGKKYLPPHLQ